MLKAVGAERALLALFLKKPDDLLLVNDVLDESDFTNTANKLTFSIIEDLVRENSDVKITNYLIISRAEEKGIDNYLKVTQNGELLEAIDATKNSIDSRNLKKYVAQIKKATIKRSLINTLKKTEKSIESFDGDITSLINTVESEVLGSVKVLDYGDDGIENLSEDFEQTIHEYADEDATLGLDIGFDRWQRDAGALRNGTITGIFARAKEGKSQIAAHALRKVGVEGSELLGQLPVFYLDTEMQKRDQQMRLCSMMTGVPYSRIESGAWRSKEDEYKKVCEAFKKIKSKPIYYKNIAGRSINYVIPMIRKFIYKYAGGKAEGTKPRCLVIYDYIKIMNPSDIKSIAEWQMLGFILSKLHDLASDLNFPMLVFGQLNREALRTDSIGNIAGSDRIVHNTDSITLFRKKKQDEVDMDGTRRGSHILKVVASRKGAGHDYDEWINLHFDKSRGAFEEDKRASEVNEALRSIQAISDRLDDSVSNFGSIRNE